MKKYRSDLIIFLMLTLCYLLLPMLANDTGGILFILLMVLPLITVILAIAHAKICGFRWYYAIVAGILFLLPVFLHMNDSALIYCVIYAVLSLIGQGMGLLLRKL